MGGRGREARLHLTASGSDHRLPGPITQPPSAIYVPFDALPISLTSPSASPYIASIPSCAPFPIRPRPYRYSSSSLSVASPCSLSLFPFAIPSSGVRGHTHIPRPHFSFPLLLNSSALSSFCASLLPPPFLIRLPSSPLSPPG